MHAPHNRPYWLDTAPPRPWVPAQPLPPRSDVAIIGAGLTGLSAALHLARQGAQVTVLEQGDVGYGASTRNAGMTLAGLKLGPAELIRRHGQKQARSLYRATLDAIDFTERFTRDERIDCEFQRHGALWAAATPGHFAGLAESQRLLREVFEHDTHLVSKDALPAELASPRYHGGLVDPISAGLHPGKLVAQLARQARAAGALICENQQVAEIARQADGFTLRTSAGSLEARTLVAATNGYTPDCLPGLRRRVIPIGSYIVVTAPLGPDRARALIPRGRMAFDTKHYLAYFRLTSDHRLLFGGRTSFAPLAEREAAQRLRAHMDWVFPDLGDVALDYYWSGNVAFTFDQLPHLGEQDGIHYAMGYCGHGVANGLYFGRALAQRLAGEGGALPFRELPFPARVYYRRKPWFLPLAGAYYKWKDRLAR